MKPAITNQPKNSLQSPTYTLYSFSLMFFLPATIIVTVYLRLFVITRNRLKVRFFYSTGLR